MADENERPGAEDEVPRIPVPDNEEQGTPVPRPEIPSEDVQGTPVLGQEVLPDEDVMGAPAPQHEFPDEDVQGAPAPDEGVFGAPAKMKPPFTRRGFAWRGSGRWPLWGGIGCLLTCCLCCLLPLCLLAATGAGLAAIFSNSETTDTQTQQLTIDPNEPLTLSVDGTSGSIRIRRGESSSEVSITTTKKAHGWTKSAAEKELERIAVDIEQPAGNENEIAVTVDTERREDSFWFLANQVDMTITIPEEAAITVTNNTGDITVVDVRARALNLRSNTGDITFEGSFVPDTASAMEIQTNTGSIALTLPADTTVELNARTNTGRVTVSDSFDQLTDVSEGESGAGESWTGTLGDTTSNPPALRLHTNTGSIRVQAG